MNIDIIKENAKAVAALVGSICTALLINNLSGGWEHELTVISIVATTVTTWAVTNKKTEKQIQELLPADPYPEGYRASVELEAEGLEELPLHDHDPR